MTVTAKAKWLLPLLLVPGCTGPQQMVHYSCEHGMLLDVTYEEATHTARVHDMIGQERVLPEVSSDPSGTIYRDSAVTFIRNVDGTVVYAARDSSHESITCAPAKLTASLP
jgi:hypothetical protein